MKKIALIFFLAFFLPSFSVYAQDYDIDVQGVYDAVPDDGADVLEQLKIESALDSTNLNLQNTMQVLSQIVRDNYISPLKSVALAMVVIILSSFINAMEKDNSSICELAGALTICAIYLPQIASTINLCSEIVESVNVFLAASVPIYALIYIACGSPTVGASLSTVVLVTANIFTSFCKNLIIPSLSIFLGLSVSSAFSHVNIKSICNGIYAFIKWVLVISVTVFSSVISIQSALSATTDVVTTKTIKLIAGSAVPIVGKAFGEGVAAVQNSVNILKSGVGAFGIIASICIFITPTLKVLLWLASSQITLIVSELFEYKKVAEIMAVLIIVLKIILAILISLCIISVVTSAVTLFVGV